MAEIGPGELAYKQRQKPSLAHSREISEAFRVFFWGGERISGGQDNPTLKDMSFYSERTHWVPTALTGDRSTRHHEIPVTKDKKRLQTLSEENGRKKDWESEWQQISQKQGWNNRPMPPNFRGKLIFNDSVHRQTTKSMTSTDWENPLRIQKFR